IAILTYHFVGRLLGREVFMMYKDRETPTPYVRPGKMDKRLAKSLRGRVSVLRESPKSDTEATRLRLLKGAAG
ncbi:uncharacterized protein METZ01_LOCUS423304, partial [marine metagenome]